MVSAASAAICYVRTTTGGTSKTLEYAKEKNLRIISIEIDRNTQPKNDYTDGTHYRTPSVLL